jgi:8-oxo-dGTP pyrophosphatase MutT (NUDIX family)
MSMIERLNGIISKKPKRAGIIPYMYNEDGDVLVYCMIPSDAEYGGTSPQMAKGKTDNLSAYDTAIKEGQEELGLIVSNINGRPKSLGVFEYSGMKQTDEIEVFYCEIKDKDKWGTPHYETGWSGWVNISKEFNKIRKSQQQYFKKLLEKL